MSACKECGAKNAREELCADRLAFIKKMMEQVWTCADGEEDCNEEHPCRGCCDHEFDMDEGGYCINGCETHHSGN